ncbi:hypothetical protein [uncultured Gammaproteobacteria bacterium]|nr:hypothetical protein [uncultured Gammaproteobacteria bacterium]
MCSLSFSVDSMHPSIPGHFPGNPVVPGAVIIENVIQAFSKLHGVQQVTYLSTVKFMKPILLNQKITIHFQNVSTGLISFKCTYGDKVSVLGRLKVK